MLRLISALCLCLCLALLLPALAQDPDDVAFVQGQKLQADGKEWEAFCQFLRVPGAEYLAARIARPKAAQFVERLQQAGKLDIPTPRLQLITGDLYLAQGKKDEALAAYRKVVAGIAKTPNQGWPDDLVPPDYYFVEPPDTDNGDEGLPRPDFGKSRWLPFQAGPGSQRDNWLIRRFITLEAWPDAAAEFARIWKLQQASANPFIAAVRETTPDRQPVERKYAFFPRGYDGLAMAFAIDYAYFVKRQKGDALAILLPPLLAIDLDHNPNVFPSRVPEQVSNFAGPTHPELVLSRYGMRWGRWGGLSRKEYIRLAFGEFKTQGKEAELMAALEDRLEHQNNSARRVMARIRLLQGRPDDALKLELDYIANGQFDALTAAYRRGLAYEEAQKTTEAVAEYEKVLALPYTPPALPDADEETTERQMMSQMDVIHPDPATPAGQAQFQTEVLGRLQRLYGALGKTDQVLALMLRQFDINETLLENSALLDETAARFKAANHTEQLTAWAKGRVGAVKSPAARANLCWLAGDDAGTIRAVVELAKGKNPADSTLEGWKDRFRRRGKPQIQALLTALVEANPRDARSRLELLDLQDRLAGTEAISALESLLETGENNPFWTGKGSSNRTRFRNYDDLAYRLMRLYEKNNQLDKLQALALRIAGGQKPFSPIDVEQEAYRDKNGVIEDANACLALAVEHADSPEKQQALLAALPATPFWQAARRQLQHREGGFSMVNVGPTPWANLPAGVAPLVSLRNALSVCAEVGLVYVGHPWGVSVFDRAGQPVKKIALGTSADDMAIAAGSLWVGTPVGLYRITAIKVADDTIDALNERRHAPFTVTQIKAGEPFRVLTLSERAGVLWIGTPRDVRTYDPKTNTLRIFSPREMGLGENGADCSRFLFDGQYVWADGRDGCRRYDTRAGTWQAPASLDERYPVGLIGTIDDTLWGHVWVDEKLRDRPCIIDRATLAIRVIPIEIQREAPCINGPFGYYGRLQGKLIFGAGYPGYRYDAENGKLQPLPDNIDRGALTSDENVPAGLNGGTLWRKPDGSITCYNDITHRLSVLGQPFYTGNWQLLSLTNGGKVLVGAETRETAFQNPYEDASDATGGILFIDAKGKIDRIADHWWPDLLMGDEVYGSLVDNGRRWLCTSHGLAMLNLPGQIESRVTRGDGLPANTIMNSVALDGKLYFASRWGDDGGGLIVYNPKTRTFTSLTESDGLAANSLQGVALEGDAVKLIYGVQYRRYIGGPSYQQFPPSLYHPATGEITDPGAPKLMNDQEADAVRPKPGTAPLPYLGGVIFGREVIDGKTYLYGSRGLVILDGEQPPLVMEQQAAQVVADPQLALIAEAEKRRGTVRTTQELQQTLRDPNPFYRANVLSLLGNNSSTTFIDENAALIATQLADPEPRLRSTALYILSVSRNNDVVIPAFRRLLTDEDGYIRAMAAVELVKRGEQANIDTLRDILRKSSRNGYGNFPFGADSSVGVQLEFQAIYRAISGHATPELFTVMLEYPIRPENFEHDALIFPKLGESLRRDPKSAEVLLHAYDTEAYRDDRVIFAQAVFKQAGKEMLPALHQALASTDRVVRSNAARACGAIGDPSSIPPLIKSLDLESGLARASIVWALGELKAREALPVLVKIYLDAVNDDQRRHGAGLRSAQQAAVIGAEYERLGDLNSVGADWNELKNAARPAGVDIENEQLLTPAMVLEAVRKIGPAFAQEFYRALAGEKDDSARLEAAARLAEATAEMAAGNIPILRNLLSDRNTRVQLVAAVSLLIVNTQVATDASFLPPARQLLLDALAVSNTWQRRITLQELARANQPGVLSFARDRLTALLKEFALAGEDRQLAENLLKNIL